MNATPNTLNFRDAIAVNSITPVWQGQRRYYLAGLVVLGIAQALVLLGISILVAALFANMTHATPATEQLGLMMLLAAFFLATLRWAERVCAEHLGQNYIAQIRLRLFRHLMYADQRAAQRFSHGAMALRFVTDLNGLRQWVALGLARLIVIVSTLIIVLTVLAYTQPTFMLLVAGALVLAIVLTVGIGSWLTRSIRAVRKHRARLAATVTDRINTLATVQACGQERREVRRVKRQSQSLYAACIRRAHVTGALFGSLEATTVIATTAILMVASSLVQSQQVSLAEVAASMTLLGLLLTPIRDLGRMMDYWQQWRISNEKIAHFLCLPQRPMRKLKLPTSLPTNPDTGQLSARGISIDGLLEPSDLDVPAGHHIVLEGHNGSGKTSLLLTLAGVLPLQHGHLELDGERLIDQRVSRMPVNGIGVVSPDLGLMRGSLLRNLIYANTKVSDETLTDVLQRCDLVNLVQRLPNGLRSRLSEGGKNLSVGERKRILLARALLMHPRLLLLDELDAHLDAQSLTLIETALQHYKGSVIEISHHRKLALNKPLTRWTLADAKINVLETERRSICRGAG